MPLDRLSERDPYLRRILITVGLAALALVIGALLGPARNEEGEWYEHTGIEGPTLILDDIDIVSDDDVVTQKETDALADATMGVPSEAIPQNPIDESERPLPRVDDPGRLNPNRTVMRKLEDGLANALDPIDRVQMSRSAQQSLDFVLLHSVSPDYPAKANDALKRREIIVRVNLYVDETGHVAQAYVDRNNGGPLYEQAVLAAVRQWIYKPLRVNGQASGFWDPIYFTFNFNSNRSRSTTARDAAQG